MKSLQFRPLRERFGVLAPCFTGEANSAGKLTTHKEEK
jgi:hypothetical protein